MKKIKLFSLMGFLILSYCVSAQIKVYDDNRVKFFGDRPMDDFYKDLSMQVYGANGSYLTNGKIGFGDYGTKTNNSPWVFIGEFGNNVDSDILELRGSRGISLTHTQGYEYGHTIGFMRWYSPLLTQRFEFSTDVYASGFIINSDERFKENIQPLKQSALKLKSVKGVSYNLKADKSFDFSQVSSPETEKEKKDMVELSRAKEKIKNLEKERFGFVAQNLMTIFPDLVEKGSNGYLHVDYLGMIPVLVESIKEQQQQIAMLTRILKLSKTN